MCGGGGLLSDFNQIFQPWVILIFWPFFFFFFPAAKHAKTTEGKKRAFADWRWDWKVEGGRSVEECVPARNSPKKKSNLSKCANHFIKHRVAPSKGDCFSTFSSAESLVKPSPRSEARARKASAPEWDGQSGLQCCLPLLLCRHRLHHHHHSHDTLLLPLPIAFLSLVVLEQRQFAIWSESPRARNGKEATDRLISKDEDSTVCSIFCPKES